MLVSNITINNSGNNLILEIEMWTTKFVFHVDCPRTRFDLFDRFYLEINNVIFHIFIYHNNLVHFSRSNSEIIGIQIETDEPIFLLNQSLILFPSIRLIIQIANEKYKSYILLLRLSSTKYWIIDTWCIIETVANDDDAFPRKRDLDPSEHARGRGTRTRKRV